METWMHDELLRLGPAATLIGQAPRTLRDWALRGLVETVRVGPVRRDLLGRDRRALRFRRSALEAMIDVRPARQHQEAA